mgnify:CR=1 FL=1
MHFDFMPGSPSGKAVGLHPIIEAVRFRYWVLRDRYSNSKNQLLYSKDGSSSTLEGPQRLRGGG